MRKKSHWSLALGVAFAIPAGASASIAINIPDAVQVDSNTFALHASVNTGGAGVTFAWSKDPLPSLSHPFSPASPLGRNGNGPGPVVFSPPDQPVTLVTLDVIGTYILTLTAIDKANPANKASAQTMIDFFPGNLQGYAVPAIDPRWRDPDTHLGDFLSARGGRF